MPSVMSVVTGQHADHEPRPSAEHPELTNTAELVSSAPETQMVGVLAGALLGWHAIAPSLLKSGRGVVALGAVTVLFAAVAAVALAWL
jgi:hypothetical protein